MPDRKKKARKNDLLWKPENGWKNLNKTEARRTERYAQEYISFLSAAKTEREAHDVAVALAEKAGYRSLASFGDTAGTLKPGDRVYRSYGGKTLLLAHIGNRPVADGLDILGGHTDAPRLDAKPRPIYEDSELALLDTHYYGGIKKYQWVTLPLALHGVVVKQNGEKVGITIGEDPKDPVLVITDILPHLGKDQAKKTMADGISGEGLNVLIGSRPVDGDGEDKDAKEKVKQNVLRILATDYGIEEEDFASAEIEIVPAGPARDLGLDRSMILGYAHDDRVCSYACLRALLDLKETPETTAVALFCDKEEIGSVGATGMDSTFLENTVAELICRQEAPYSDLHLRRCLERSRMLSADVNVCHDPNYADVSSPNNAAWMNRGTVLAKYTGSGGKSRSSEASAEFVADMRRIFNNANVAWQIGELGKVDMGGGGTIALFMARYGMDVIDCGVGVLSMHGPWEVISKLDAYMTYRGYRVFLEQNGGRRSA